MRFTNRRDIHKNRKYISQRIQTLAIHPVIRMVMMNGWRESRKMTGTEIFYLYEDFLTDRGVCSLIKYINLKFTAINHLFI